MQEIDANTAADYLRRAGRLDKADVIRVRELSGGVSNIVLRVDVGGRPPFVIKQCRERLRVAMEWLAPLDRIWTESATLEVLGRILPEESVPTVLFEDRPDYLFAMSCAPDDAVTWKALLMEGCDDPATAVRHREIADRLGFLLGTIHDEARSHPALRARLADTSLFEQLRVDPYYRTTAQRHPDRAAKFDALIASMDRSPAERTLVLGDFSPKNILVHAGGLMLLDFECAHAGDATFDIGFFLTHLLLKEVRAIVAGGSVDRPYLRLTHEFWDAYLRRRAITSEAATEFTHRANRHTAACCLARVDGKSPVEYLDARGQSLVRRFARLAMVVDPVTWNDFIDSFESAV
jgi:5-methylthioribose kinase